MASRKHPTRRGHVATADRAAAGQQDRPPTVEVTAFCLIGQCSRCSGLIVSLLAEPGTRCGHDCHQERGAA